LCIDDCENLLKFISDSNKTEEEAIEAIEALKWMWQK
jgi:hypothetical protein